MSTPYENMEVRDIYGNPIERKPKKLAGGEGKHTPDRWTVVPTSRSRLELEIKAAGASIATVFASSATPNHEANARLIAAAPDLLEACTDMMVELARSSRPSFAIQQRMSAAITRATAPMQEGE